MRIEYFIGWRYLFSRRHSKILSMFTLISIAGVMVGVMALIVILAVLNGFHDDLKEKILGTMPHVTISTFGAESITGYDSLLSRLEQLPGVASVAPLIYSEGMVTSESQQSAGVFLRGVIPEREQQITQVGDFIHSGDFTFHWKGEGQDYPGAVIGNYLALLLRVGVGDVITVWTPRGVKITPFGLSAPWRKFRVTGLFETGLYDVDSKFVYLSLEEAQAFFGIDHAVTDIELRLDDLEQAMLVREQAVEALGGYPYTGTDWISQNRNLFEALKLEKAVMFVILTLIILVASFNIVSTLTVLVMDKTREIGILRSMGLSARAVGLIFVVNGMVIGAVGTLLGAVSGSVLSWALDKYQLIEVPGDVYFISNFPVNMRVSDTLMVVVASMLISFVATIYPALRAAALPPVDAIRYE